MSRPRRLLTLGHSYVVALNRRLAHEMARQGAGRWDVTVAAPRFAHGDLRPIHLEPMPGEACRLVPVGVYGTHRPHVMAYGRAMRRALGDRWDLVHSWEEPYILAGLQIAHWAAGRPLVYYTFQNIPKRYVLPFRWIERGSMARASAWIAAGETVKEALGSRIGYAGKPHRVITLGVDVEAFQPDPAAGRETRVRLGWPEPGLPVVGYLGRFTPEKGLGTLTGALDAVRTPWRALFVGGGTLEAELRTWAARYPDRVRVVTGVPHGDVPRYLNAMDVLAAPSLTTPRWREQLGRMLIEAMACRVPVVGSDSGEIPHVVGGAGLVVREADVTAWADALGGLLESPARRRELGEAGSERARTAFAWPVIARRHLDFFDEICDNNSTSRTQ